MFQTDFSKAELKARREALCAIVGDATVLIAGAPASHAMARFRQGNDFYYLCGVEVPHAYLAIDGASGRSTLFLPEARLLARDDDYPVICADDPAYAVEVSGVDEAAGLAALDTYLADARTVYTHFQDAEVAQCCLRSLNQACAQIEADPWDGRPNRGEHLVQLISSRHDGVEVHDVARIIRRMRMDKSPSEIALLRRAGELSALGIRDALAATRPGVMEYQLAAVMQYRYLAGGAMGNGYMPIVAGGVNAYHGHYCINNCAVKAGDLVLADCAPDYRYYTSDITRVWPVSGTYTPAQRALYGFVIEYHKTLIAAIRPGRTIPEIEDEVAEVMRGRLGEFEFASPVHAAGAQWMFDFRKHLAHCVGMSVHDGCLHKEAPLRPGIVFSVDPQMRIEEERIYLRVEDTGVVTEDGFDVFTKDVPIELDALEALMQEEGIAQIPASS